MRSLVFDTGPFITLTLNNLLWTLEPLHDRFDGDFCITEAVYKELIERPLQTKKYKFEALQILPMITSGRIKLLKDQKIRQEAEGLLELANKCFKAHGNWIKIVHPGEMEVVAASLIYGADAVVIDERTTRDLIENPSLIEKRLQKKLHTDVTVVKDNLKRLKKQLKRLKVIRSFELVTVAFELGLLNRYILKEEEKVIPNLRKAVLEGVLWAVKLSGCSVREDDIALVLKSMV